MKYISDCRGIDEPYKSNICKVVQYLYIFIYDVCKNSETGFTWIDLVLII